MAKKSSTKITVIHKPLEKLNLLEKYSPEMIIFETPKEFEQYLTEHKDELDDDNNQAQQNISHSRI